MEWKWKLVSPVQINYQITPALQILWKCFELNGVLSWEFPCLIWIFFGNLRFWFCRFLFICFRCRADLERLFSRKGLFPPNWFFDFDATTRLTALFKLVFSSFISVVSGILFAANSMPNRLVLSPIWHYLLFGLGDSRVVLAKASFNR